MDVRGESNLVVDPLVAHVTGSMEVGPLFNREISRADISNEHAILEQLNFSLAVTVPLIFPLVIRVPAVTIPLITAVSPTTNVPVV